MRLHIYDPRLELHKPVTYSEQDHVISHICTCPRHNGGKPLRFELSPVHIQELNVHA